jgi:hypothetical protein
MKADSAIRTTKLTATVLRLRSAAGREYQDFLASAYHCSENIVVEAVIVPKLKLGNAERQIPYSRIRAL